MNRLRQPGDSDYDVLGLSPGATDEEIEIAFRELIDGEGYRVGVPLNRQWLRAHQIKHAHASLSDPEKRRAYDEWLSRADREPWVTGADDPAMVELVLPSPKPRPARPIKNRPAPAALVPTDAVRTISAEERVPDRAPGPDAEETARPPHDEPPSPDLPPPLNDNAEDPLPASIDNRKASVRSWGLGAVLAISLGLVLLLSGVEWDRRPSTIEGTPEVTPDGRRASVAGRGNEVPVQEVSELIPKDMADARSPVDKKPAGIAPPAPKGPSLPAAAAEAREIAPIQKPPVDRSPTIKAARMAAVKPISPIGSAPQWIGGGPTDADNRRGQYQGTVALQVNVQPSGRVSNCAPVRGSGNAGLDKLTCRLVQQRARFIPARDPRGKRVVGQAYITFAWVRK